MKREDFIRVQELVAQIDFVGQWVILASDLDVSLRQVMGLRSRGTLYISTDTEAACKELIAADMREQKSELEAELEKI